MLANTSGILNGIDQWEKELDLIQSKYSQTKESDLAKEIISKINMTDKIDKQNKTYLNYKWIFAYQSSDSIKLRKGKTIIQKELDDAKITKWFLTQDRFDKRRTFLVLHGIRNIRKLNEWKKRIIDKKPELLEKNNFVVLSSDYKKMIRDKKLRFDEK